MFSQTAEVDPVGRVGLGQQPTGTSRLAGDALGVLEGKKILHAPIEITAGMYKITKGLKQAGIYARSANYYDTWLKYQCDYNLNINNLPPEKQLAEISRFASQAAAEYDLFHFHFGQSLLPNLGDLATLKDNNKKIVFHFWGSDACPPEWTFYNQAKFLGYNPPKPFLFTRPIYQSLKKINAYADVMIGPYCLPRGIFFPGMIEASTTWTLEEKKLFLQDSPINKDPNLTYFLHAPSAHWKKGSFIILNLLEECRQEGLPIEIIHVHQIHPKKAQKLYAAADFAIDQVGVGTFGLFGIEMMAWETPVLAYQTPFWDQIRNHPPVIKITKENFKQRIVECVAMKERGEIKELVAKGRNWVLENVDMARDWPKYISMYKQLLSGNAVPQYPDQGWYQWENKLLQGHKSDFYKYMNEYKVFAAMGLNTPDYDRQLYN